MVHLLWFVQEKAEGEDTQLLLGVYSSEAAAKSAIQRLQDKPGFTSFPAGFQIHPYELDRDHWTEGFVLD
jgi:hypothetical protein